MATREGLGRCVAEYKTSRSGLAKVVVIALASSAVAAVFFGVSLAGGPDDLGGRIVLFVLGVLFTIPSLLGVYGLTRGRSNALRLHEGGITVHRAGKDTPVLWGEVDSYTDGAFLRIETSGGESIAFGLDGLRASEEVLARLREEVVVRRLLPGVQAMLREGDTVELDGGFTLDAAGVVSPGSEGPIPWSELVECTSTQREIGSGKVTSRRTFVVLRTANGTFEGAIDSTSDREVLLALCHATLADRKRGR